MDRTFIETQITNTKATIVAIQAALDAFALNGAVTTYKLDTGQTVTTVTRSEINILNAQIDVLYNRIAVLEARLNGASTVVRPAY